MTPSAIVAAAAVAFAALCVATDLRNRRIPNLLSGCGLVAGLALNATLFGAAGLAASAAGCAIAVALLLAPFALGGLGGGDVKMMAAVGALLGPLLALQSLLFGLALGGVVMAVHLVRIGRLGATARNLGAMAAASLAVRSIEPLRMSADQPGAVTLPYSVPLALGTLAALAFSGGVLP